MSKDNNKNGLMLVKLFIKLLQRSLSLPRCKKLNLNVKFKEELNDTVMLPRDVKEGHFAVFAAKGEEPKRFVVELGYLTNPAFLRLLEQAKEEYGLEQKGVLSIPCQPEELEKILQESREKKTADAEHWSMVCPQCHPHHVRYIS